MTDTGYWYLMSPYTAATTVQMEARYIKTLDALYDLTVRGLTVYSPIVQFHELAKRFDMAPNDPLFYAHGIKMLEASRGGIVLMLHGWEKSVGIKAEVERCLALDIPVMYIREVTDAAAKAIRNNRSPESPEAGV